MVGLLVAALFRIENCSSRVALKGRIISIDPYCNRSYIPQDTLHIIFMIGSQYTPRRDCRNGRAVELNSNDTIVRLPHRDSFG
jgi:hypothetical protein